MSRAGVLGVAGVAALAFSGLSVAEDYSGYAHTAACTLKTVGMGLTGSVTGFPVPIVVNNADVMAATAADGSDIRFSKADNTTPLSYEVEMWDPYTLVRGAVWVKLDTVYSERDDQVFIMHYGKTGDASAASGPAVFDTSNGFVWVCHLSAAGAISNSAGYNLPGMLAGAIAGHISIAGPIGMADSLDAGAYILVPHNEIFNFNQEITLSAWAYGGGPGQGQIITKNAWVPKGNASWQLAYSNAGDAVYFATSTRVGLDTSTEVGDAQYSPAIADTNGWHHIVGVKTATQKIIYVNGVAVATKDVTTSDPFATCSTHVLIGAQNEWRGYVVNHLRHPVDEPRIEKVGRSADWVKLCYETQKPGQTALATGPLSVGVRRDLRSSRLGDIVGSARLAGNVLEIRVPGAGLHTVDVFGMNGALLVRKAGTGAAQYRIPASALPCGVSTVRIASAGTTMTAKVVIGR